MGTVQMNPNAVNTPTLSLAIGRKGGSAEYTMLQVQLLVAKDFSDQLQQVGEKIKFLSQVKKDIRAKISAVQEFQAKNVNAGRKDGKKYYDASASECASLFSNFEQPEYNLNVEDASELTVGWTSQTFDDSGAKHHLDDADGNGPIYTPLQDGKVQVTDWANFFNDVAAKGKDDPAGACEMAKQAGSDDTDLPFYFGHINNTCDDGTPKFAVWQDSVDKMLDQLKNTLEDVNTDAELLSTKLNMLTNQRKAALDGAQQLRQKMDDIRSNTAAKLDR
jgi:hypothetical protein